MSLHFERPADPVRALLTLGAFAALSWTFAAHSPLGRVHAQELPAGTELPLGPFSIDDENPENSVPSPELANKHPLEMGYLVMTLTERGEAAERLGEHAKAAHYYLAVAKAGMDTAVGFSKACTAFAAAGDRDSALAACRDALGRDGATVNDSLRYLNLMLKKQTMLTPEELTEVEAVLARLQEKVGDGERGAHMVTSLRCQLAVRLEDEARLETCVEAVKGYAPESVEAFVFRSLYALKQERWDDAQKLIADAERAGIPADVIKRTQESVQTRRQYVEENAKGRIQAGTWWLLGIAAALTAALGFALSRRTLKPKAA